MLFKIITFFLVGMAILAMFGKLKTPKLPERIAKQCEKCGRYKIGKGPCSCVKKG